VVKETDMQTQNSSENAVTVIIGQLAHPGREQQLLAWQHDVNEAASHYAGRRRRSCHTNRRSTGIGGGSTASIPSPICERG
jgi:antibiotic biosynthesis monooxygenase (ABM) superfamily enzyme